MAGLHFSGNLEVSGRREEAILTETQEPWCWQEGQRAGSAAHRASSGPCSWSAQLLLHRPRKNPLFIVDLVLDGSGVHYSTPLEHFETSLLNLFDKGILATHAVPQLEKV